MFSETTTTAIVGILALWADLGIVVAIRYKGLSNKAILTEDLSFGRNFINILKSTCFSFYASSLLCNYSH